MVVVWSVVHKQTDNAMAARPILPVLVHVKRNAKHRTVTQGCTYWIGPKIKFNGLQLGQSFWANPFPDSTESVKDGRYQNYLRALLQSHPTKWAELHGQVLGCVCKEEDLVQWQHDQNSALAAALPPSSAEVKPEPDSVSSSSMEWTPQSGRSDPLLMNAGGCPGRVVLGLWQEHHPDPLPPILSPVAVASITTIPHEHQEEEKHDAAASSVVQKRKAGSEIQKPKPKKQRQKKPPRTVKTTPAGLKDKGKLWPWPPLLPELNNDTVFNPVRYEDTVYLDEAGRGCLAGPMMIGAVVLLKGFDVAGLHDSKLLTEHERELLYDQLMQHPCIQATVVAISHDTIDQEGMGRAWPLGMRRAIKSMMELRPPGTLKYAVIDGRDQVKVDDIDVVAEEKGDRRFVGIAAAAVLAKVTRDRLMTKLSLLPEYSPFQSIFAESSAYGTPYHCQLIQRRQLYTDIHRTSYDPLRSCLLQQPGYPLLPPCCASPSFVDSSSSSS